MGKKDGGALFKAYEPVNLIIMLIMFAGYALTFMVPRFYGATDRYVGVFVFICLGLLLIHNVDILSLIKKKDREFIILILVMAVTLINLLIVGSGLGAFFVAADFMLIFFLSGRLKLSETGIIIIGCCYAALLLYWFFIAYPRLFADYAYYGYNTNTAATFTIYTLLCVFLLTVILSEKKGWEEPSGFIMTLLMVKGVQLALYHRARGAFIMLILFMVLWFLVPKKWWDVKGFYYGIWILATFGSLLFVAMYVVVGATGVNFRLPFFYKDIFSGRDKIICSASCSLRLFVIQ